MAESRSSDQSWFSVRSVLHDRGNQAYEERVTLWQAATFDEAIALAEAEAAEHASAFDDVVYVGLAQAYRLPEPPRHGAEVFSLIRASTLAPESYLDMFFDTGAEFQRGVDPE